MCSTEYSTYICMLFASKLYVWSLSSINQDALWSKWQPPITASTASELSFKVNDGASDLMDLEAAIVWAYVGAFQGSTPWLCVVE